MQSFSSSTVSLPAEASSKSKGKLLKRLSLKPKKPLSVATGSNAAASQSTTSLVTPTTPGKSRRMFDLFSATPSRKSVDGTASMPSTPKTPKTPKTPRSKATTAPSTRSTSASMDAMRTTNSRFADAPPVPAVPKMFLVSDEVFVIASPPKDKTKEEGEEVKEEEAASSSRMSSSSSAPSSYSTRSMASTMQTWNSWVDNLGSFPSQDAVASPKSMMTSVELQPETNRSSLDDIDDQIVLNLCMNLCDEPKAGPAVNPPSRSTSLGIGASPAPLPAPTRPLNFTFHSRKTSAPHSLGPLPPQPSDPPTEAVLRKTDQIKKRYSKQGSPLSDAASFTFPRPAPGTPKLDSISSLKSLEAGLSLDSKRVKRNHKRSSSKQSSATSSVDYSHYGNLPVKLTPGHVATRFFDSLEAPEPQEQLVSRFSEDSDNGEDARRLFGILTPVLGSVAKLTSTHTPPQMCAMDYCKLDTPATPEMLATRMSSSSVSSNSSLSDLSEEEPIFDLSQPNLDYRTVYALAQKYATSASATPALPTKTVKNPAPPKLGLLHSASKSHKNVNDPIDRSYHLRKY